MSLLNDLVEKAKKKPLGSSWTYATPSEFEKRLSELIIRECADFIFQSDEVTVGQGYMLRKKIKKYFGIEE